MAKLKLTQVRSQIGQSERHRGTLRALGLGKLLFRGQALPLRVEYFQVARYTADIAHVRELDVVGGDRRAVARDDSVLRVRVSFRPEL